MRVFVDANILIYLNVGSAEKVLDFWVELLTGNDLYTDPLVLDEVIWISRKKYSVAEKETLDFIENEILPFVGVLSVGKKEYEEATKLISSIRLKPSDALHVGAMKTNGIVAIASEDTEFDKVPGINRLWI